MDSCCILIQRFDEKGYITREVSRNIHGTVTSEVIVTRYEGGQVKEYITMEDGKKANVFSIRIDANGKYIAAKSIDADGNVESYYSDIYANEHGLVVQGKEFDSDSVFKSTFQAVYDRAVLLNSEYRDSSGKLIGSISVKLDGKRNIIERTNAEMGRDSVITKIATFTYDSYDELDNWTQRTTYDEKGKILKVTKRVFTYY